MNHRMAPEPARLNRRGFLSRAAHTAAVAAASPALMATGPAIAAEDRWKMKLSTSSIQFKSLPIEKVCQKIAELGFEAIDIWSAHAGCPHLDDVQKRLGANGLKEVLEKNHLKLCAFSVYHGGYRRYAELLGASGGGVAIHGSARACAPKELTSRMKAYLEALEPEAELAEKHNSYVAVENHGHALLDSVDSLKAFVDLNRNPRIGIALAPYHIQGRKESVEEAIRVAGKQLFFFYAWQRAGATQQLPGIGPTDCTSWIKALASIGYSRYVNPFMHGEPEPETMAAALAKSRDYLEKCRAKAATT